MRFVRFCLQKSRAIAHMFGLHRIAGLRRLVDCLKEFTFLLSFPFAVKIQGVWMKGLASYYFITGVYEADTTAYFRRVVQPGWTAIDVGADFGYYTLIFSRLVGTKGRVFAFEPFTARYGGFLLGNIARNALRNVIPIPFGLDERPATHDYFEDTHGFYTTTGRKPSERVSTIVFDDFFMAFGGPVDIVKIDTEGSELRVLHGMRKTIITNPKIRIVIEIAPHVLARSGSSAKELIDLLEELGLRYFWINPDGSDQQIMRQELEDRLSRVKYTNIVCQR